MKNMFSWCSSLKNIDLSSFNTNNVTDMTKMFNACLSLKKLNLSNFNTYNVTNMKLMFKFCCSLKEIKFSSNFKTDNVTNMKYMFSHCSSLQDLRISHFNFNNVINMRCIFQYCSWELKEKLEDTVSQFNLCIRRLSGFVDIRARLQHHGRVGCGEFNWHYCKKCHHYVRICREFA